MCFSDVAKHCPALLVNLTHIPRRISKNTRLRNPKAKNSMGKFVSNPSTDEDKYTGGKKTTEQIKLSVAPVALNTVLPEKVGKLSKQTSAVANFRW